MVASRRFAMRRPCRQRIATHWTNGGDVNIAYYSELDPFTGGIAQHGQDFGQLVRDLTTLLLLYDVVIVPPGNLLEHGLALPAFEALAPFVVAGKLTTSVEPSSPNPHAFIDDRARLYVEDRLRHKMDPAFGPSRPGTLRFLRQKAIEETTSRWRDILPATWTIHRDVTTQVADFIDRIERFCEETSCPSIGDRRILRIVSGMRECGGAHAGRTTLLAALAAQQGMVAPHVLSRLAVAIQAIYFHMGASSHEKNAPEGQRRTCKLYPGRFARLLRSHTTLLESLGFPPYDWHATPRYVAHRLRRMGLDLGYLLAIEPKRVFELSQSPEWREAVELILKPKLTAEVALSAQALFGRFSDFRAARGPIGRFAHSAGAPRCAQFAPAILPAPWQLATQAVLGAHIAITNEAPAEEVTLDLRTLNVTQRGGHSVQLARPQAHLVSLLAIAGDAGLTVHDIKQLALDLDRLDASEQGAGHPPWTPQAHESTALDKARLNRVNVLKARTNHAIGKVGFQITVMKGRGRWQLSYPRGANRPLRLEGTIWDLVDALAAPEPPAGLSRQQVRLWRALVDTAPHYLSLHELARALGKRDGKRGHKQTIDAINKLNRKLDAGVACARVIRVKRGLYRLLPRASGPPARFGNKRPSFLVGAPVCP